MGHRTVKRVPMNFGWPINRVWDGYLSPNYRPCPSEDCDNGSTVAMQWVEKIVWQLLILAGADEEKGLHPWLERVPCRPDKPPDPEAVRALSGGLAGRDYRAPFGHDAIDRYSAARKVVEAAGLDPKTWGICPVCEGHAMHPDDIELSESWKPTQPPEGPGWQLWETTSEGSPQSPVFGSPEALAAWCADNATSFADFKWTANQWLTSFVAGTTDTDTLLVMRSRK